MNDGYKQESCAKNTSFSVEKEKIIFWNCRDLCVLYVYTHTCSHLDACFKCTYVNVRMYVLNTNLCIFMI